MAGAAFTEIGTTQQGCKVCGNPVTVRAHIVPRAIALDVKGNDTALLVGESERKRNWPSQNGIWDHCLLCEEHERHLSECDRIGVEITRKISDVQINAARRQGLVIENVNPRLLATFAVACVWRYVKSRYGTKYRESLGPYDAICTRYIFENFDYNIPVLVALSPLVAPDDSIAPIISMPLRKRIFDRNAWSFQVNAAYYSVFLDKRPLPEAYDRFRADMANPLSIVVPGSLSISDWKGWRKLFEGK